VGRRKAEFACQIKNLCVEFGGYAIVIQRYKFAITRERQTPGDGATQSYGPGSTIQAAGPPNVTKKTAL
jgi:hypothetical protein